MKHLVTTAALPPGKGCPYCGDTAMQCEHYVDVETSNHGIVSVIYERTQEAPCSNG